MARDPQFDMLYILVSSHDHYVVTHGIRFQDFLQSLAVPLENLLLLKHAYTGGEFHYHTKLDYVTKDQIAELAKKHVDEFGDFCWIDFEDVFNLDTLDGPELAELLYLGHMKHHLSPPFFQKLNNRYVYLTESDGWYNKTYFRNWSDFYDILGTVLADRATEIKMDRWFAGFRKKKVYPRVDRSILHQLSPYMTEGIVLSFSAVNQLKGQLSIPFWVVGDFVDMEEMREHFQQQLDSPPAGRLFFDKKIRDWGIAFTGRSS